MSKTVLVTGGSRGIGRAASLLAAADGWDVAVNYAANADAADEVVAAVQAEGQRAFAIQGDVSRGE
ncbi:MAG: SDR family NAD(P)-dependent oxidoreductase, partial [Rhodospirillaceae bacterium]|nr:SDR family NAD(P)-dependent oxidoreductase [Rhodospirillaceae bacterium]